MQEDGCLVIINPTSGSGRGKAVADATLRELSAFEPVRTFLTGARGDAERAAREAADSGCRRVVVAGGDGTINEVINGLAESKVECGIVPVGTANVLARELGLPINDPRAAAEIIHGGHTRSIDLGLVGDRYFAAMAGFGFDAAVVHRVVPKIKEMIGPGAYVLSIFGELVRHCPANFVIEADGRTLETEAFLVIVANTAAYAYGIQVAPEATPDDGQLNVIIFDKARPAKIRLLQQATRVLLRSHMKDPNVRSFTCRQLKISAAPEVLVQADGDVVGRTPTEVRIIPGALRVLVSGRTTD